MEDFIQNKYGYCFYDVQNAVIYNLYVHPAYRMQGKAKRLLTLAINEIRETGYGGDITIEATPRENSICLEKLRSFYGKMGLKILNPILTMQ